MQSEGKSAIPFLERADLMLFLSSVLSLFAELMLIRYIAIEVHIYAYFKNLSLMACFLGLGLGFAWTDKKNDFFRHSGAVFFGLCIILSLALILKWNALTFANPFDFMLFGTASSKYGSLAESAKSLAVILLVFCMTTYTFVGMGQLIGRYFENFTPLKAYSINVGGALLGAALFSLLCSLQTPPGVWIIVAGILYCLVRRNAVHVGIVILGIVHFTYLLPFIAGKYYGENYVETLWSPYYRIDVVRAAAAGAPSPSGENRNWGYDLKVNYDTFQSILDCTKENLARFPAHVQQGMLDAFGFPFKSLNIHPKEVLILASGNGSDVAAALRAGAEHVDAVDIDPVLTDLGKTLHPEKPYLDPRVQLYVMDARTYLKNCKKKYDFIEFAYLDSHTAFSSLSSLRTDNYIFTVDSYKEAVNLLNDRGIIFVSFICFKDWLWHRQTNALAQASGMTPLSSFAHTGQVGVGYMAAGPGIKFLNEKEISMPGKDRPVDRNSNIPLATDDWPFLFLPTKEMGLTYAIPLLMVLGISFLTVAKELRSGIGSRLNITMMLLGMAFMLLEVRAMADLSLLFGSTWLVNSSVISGVMVMILIGNWIISVNQKQGATLLAGVMLIVSLIVTTLVKPGDLLLLGSDLGKLAGVALYLLPAAFAAVVFAATFKNAKKPTEALAFNVFGGLVGVSLEYLSMQFGIRFLGWLCIAIYSLALVFAEPWKKSATPVSESTPHLPSND